MTTVNYGHSSQGGPQLSIELGDWSYFADIGSEASKEARVLVDMIVARELMLRWSPQVDFVENQRGNAVLRITFSRKISAVDLGHFMVLLQGAWFIFLTNEKRNHNFDRWDPNATVKREFVEDPHKGGVDFTEMRRIRKENQPKDRESRRIR